MKRIKRVFLKKKSFKFQKIITKKFFFKSFYNNKNVKFMFKFK